MVKWDEGLLVGVRTEDIEWMVVVMVVLKAEDRHQALFVYQESRVARHQSGGTSQ
ncbi:hypothetical protein SR1949_40620 [Sphaerospermopsis reniformis]|uniref:Transposase n=1 Tax=Sphaerospermopsis reniformis TaxID=531300 RepID=A0A480A377_9CYAN|nr:hypothetical protein SR1949_40620 [Sphaerospermopsis reniformis]